MFVKEITAHIPWLEESYQCTLISQGTRYFPFRDAGKIIAQGRLYLGYYGLIIPNPLTVSTCVEELRVLVFNW